MGKNRKHKTIIFELIRKYIVYITVFVRNRYNLIFRVILFALSIVLMVLVFIFNDRNALLDWLASIPIIFWMGIIAQIYIYLIVFKKQKCYEFLALFMMFLFFEGSLIIKAIKLSTPFIDKQADLRVCIINSKFFFDNQEYVDYAFSTFANKGCDVLMIQEIFHANSYYADNIQKYHDKYFKDYDYVFGGEFAIFSKFKIVNSKLYTWEGFLAAKIKLNNNYIWLIDVHLWNPLFKRSMLSFDNPQIDYDYLTALFLKETDGNLNAYYVRSNQVKELKNFINSINFDKESVILGGDFNSLTYHNYAKPDYFNNNLRLAHRHFLYEYSYKSYLPIILIDHSFLSSNLKLTDFQYICDPKISDHCGMILDIVVQ